MPHMTVREAILARIEAYRSRAGLSERAFGLAVCGDHKLVARIRASGVTLDRIERVEAFMAREAKPAPREVA